MLGFNVPDEKLIARKNAVYFRVNFDKFNVHVRNSVGICVLFYWLRLLVLSSS